MSYSKILTSVIVLTVLVAAAPSTAFADRRDGGRYRGRAVPRGSVHVAPPPGRAAVVPYYRGYPYRAYRSGFNLGFFYGRPGYYGSYVYGSPFFAYGYPAYGYPAYGYGYPYGYAPYDYGYAPYGYGYGGYSGRPYGGIRIDLPERDAEVYVDGYFAGIVDDFDGTFQQANLEAGPHRIEVRAPGHEPIAFDVRIEPGRTITYRSSLRPLP
jgi:hypothetical protein